MTCIRVCVLLYVCSAVYETRTYGAMRGAGGNSPHLLYSKQKNQVNPIRFPKLHENDSWITEYYRQKNNIFSLDSIHEFFNDTVYIYYLSAEGHFILKDSTVLGEVIPIPDNIDDVTK